MLNLGIYEKALPKDITWLERLTLARELGFDFIEMSVDESDDRLARLDWTDQEIQTVKQAIETSGVPIYSLCLSGHRRYPLGSLDESVQAKALEMMAKAIHLASKLGIRNIQLAGYDVYYDPKSVKTRDNFVKNLKKAVAMAAGKQVLLSIEIMDDPFIHSIRQFMTLKKQVPSPWLQVYPDLGNLSAWPDNDPAAELELGLDHIVAVHVKDTLKVTPDFPGKFKNVPFGQGDVDILGCLSTLHRLGYQGTFLIEMWSETSDNPSGAIQEALDYLLPLFKEAGYER